MVEACQLLGVHKTHTILLHQDGMQGWLTREEWVVWCW